MSISFFCFALSFVFKTNNLSNKNRGGISQTGLVLKIVPARLLAAKSKALADQAKDNLRTSCESVLCGARDVSDESSLQPE